jgi:dTMP kinase
MVAMRGVFITIEGIDGSGKTTQARRLVEWLREHGYDAVATREPGGTEVGVRLREILLAPALAITREAELFLYLSDRALHVAQLVRPALEAGRVVVCERHADSTLAYQGHGRGMDMALLRRLNEIATGGLNPDLTFVLDLSSAEPRLDAARLDRLESEGPEFLARVAAGFRELAEAERERVQMVDARGSVEAVQREIVAVVRGLLERRLPSAARKREAP